MKAWFSEWLAYVALYVLFAGSLSVAEGVAAVITGSAALAVRIAARRFSAFRFEGIVPLRLLAGRVLRALPRDTVLVGMALLSGRTGQESLQPFEGGEPTPSAAQRRALVLLAASVAPNGYAMDVRPDALLIHRLAVTPASTDRRWPV